MSMLFWLAVIPPLFLVFQVYRMDKVEKEPIGLIILLLIGGGFTTIPAGLLESVFGFVPELFGSTTMIAQLIENFLIVAAAEEGIKYLALYKLTWKHQAFDYTFDGVVYAVTVSLGFALTENIMYVGMYGANVALIRAFTAIVLHGACGLYMGIYYGLARRAFALGDMKTSSDLRKKGIVIAVLMHGTYDFCASMDGGLFQLAFFVFLIAVYVIGFRRLKKVQSEDVEIERFSFWRGDI